MVKRETCLPIHVPIHVQSRMGHSVEHIPLPGRTINVLYPTDRSHLHQDLNQNLVGLFLSTHHLIHNFLKYHGIFGPISRWWRITWKWKKFSYLNPNLPRNRMNLSSSHAKPVHDVSSESVLNFLRYHAIYHFQHHLSMVKNHFK